MTHKLQWFSVEQEDNAFIIGPHIKCKFDHWISERKEGTARSYCSNTKCVGHSSSSSGSFCAICGSTIKTEQNYYDSPLEPVPALPYPVKGLTFVSFDLDALCGYLNENLEYIVITDTMMRRMGGGYYNLYNEEFAPEIVQKEIDDTKTKYREYIQKCEKLFGAENVSVVWGIRSTHYDW